MLDQRLATGSDLKNPPYGRGRALVVKVIATDRMIGKTDSGWERDTVIAGVMRDFSAFGESVNDSQFSSQRRCFASIARRRTEGS
jgi:hypothetical protein